MIRPDEGGGDWLIRVEGGDCEVMQDATAKADLTMRDDRRKLRPDAQQHEQPDGHDVDQDDQAQRHHEDAEIRKILPNPSGDTRMQGELVKI